MATQASLNFVQSLYVGYYGRPADQEGLTYWADRLEAEGEGAIINAFGNSAEYTALSEGQTNENLVKSLYKQLFGRDADASGLAYYVGVLESGEKTLAEIALTIMNAAGGIDRVVLDTKVQAANYHTINIADADYDLAFAKALVASIDGTSTGADLDAAISSVNATVLQGEIAANYNAVVQAEKAVTDAEEALAKALEDLAKETELEYDADTSGDITLAEVQGFVSNAKVALETSVIQDGTDAELAEKVEDAEQAVRAVQGEFNADGTAVAVGQEGGARSASNLLDTFLAARSAFEADVEANGKSMDLAKQLNADLAAYLANNADISGTTLEDLQLVAQGFIADPATETEEDFLNAVATAEAEIFSGNQGASVLVDGAAATSIEDAVTLLDNRNDLFDKLSAAETGIDTAANTEFQAFLTAEEAVTEREEARAELEEAEADLAALTELNTALTEAEDALAEAEEALGYEVVDITGATALGAANTDELFVFDKEDSEAVGITLESSDAIFIGAGYALGDANNADDSQLEVFFDDSGADLVATIEVFANGTATSNVELTLTGVASVDDIAFNAETGVIALA
ncbi:MAG TPA: hypothetical protein DD442_01570 [Halomonas sp.]|jgi:hypothetical protein|nr:hypothetical protein [Halomonas sp.]|tara:strand:- start:3062 stop:4798 length:1737 start_codon:yes stop_codon:yes gene_type:complete